MEKFYEVLEDVTIAIDGELVHREQTPYQLIEIFDTKRYGRILSLNQEFQLSLFDEQIYHSKLINKEFVNTENIKTCLVIGGGDGGAIRELCKTNVEKIVLAELDEKVIEACRKYLPTVSDGAFDDTRVEIVIGDAFNYLRSTTRTFDMIVSDLPDAVETDISIIADSIVDNGIFVCQHGSGLVEFNMEELARRKGILHNYFKTADFYGAKVPSFAMGSGDQVFSFSRK